MGNVATSSDGVNYNVTLPEITVVGNKRPGAPDLFNIVPNFLFRKIVAPVAKAAANILVREETDKERRARITKDRPYTPQIDAVKNKRRSEPSDPIYQSRLGLMGLVRDKNKPNVWYLIDSEGNKVKQCAKFGNYFSSMVGKPTAGDAWTTKGIYGDSVIYSPSPATDLIPFNNLKMQMKKIRNIDRDKLETGDVVDLYNPYSKYARRAAREGRGNSHTGRIYKSEGGITYIIHNTGGNVKVEPLGNFTSPFSYWGITRISRPGTYEKPYTK